MQAHRVKNIRSSKSRAAAAPTTYVCLAAGQGKRMQPLTRYLHKAMIPFAGLPFLAYSILSVPGGSEIVIVVNCFSEQIINYFGESYEGRRIQYLKQTNPKGTG